MTSVYIIIFVTVCILIVIASLRNKAGYLHYPFWAALTFGGFAIPQFISLANTEVCPGNSLEKYIIMASLCLVASHFGFKWGCYTKIAQRLNSLMSRKMYNLRLRWLALVYILVGFIFMTKLYADEARFIGQAWEGPWTIYIFFSGFAMYGFIIASEMYLRKGNRTDLVLTLLGGSYLLLRIIIHGRRSSAVLFIIIILGLLWFRKRILIPVLLVLAVIVGGFVISASMNAYRTAIADNLHFSYLTEVDFIGNFVQTFCEADSNEILNGCYIIETADRTMGFDFGASNWNAAVFAFVPRKLVGENLKQSLMLPVDAGEDVYRVFGHIKKYGTTLTGVADSYQSLSYAGCVKFFMIAFVLGILYVNAERGSTIAIVFYLLLLTKSLTSFTHGTHGFSNGLIQNIIFLLPCLVLCSSNDNKDKLEVIKGRRCV